MYTFISIYFYIDKMRQKERAKEKKKEKKKKEWDR